MQIGQDVMIQIERIYVQVILDLHILDSVSIYYPYRAFGGQNKIVYSTRFVTRRAIFFLNIAQTLCDQSFNIDLRLRYVVRIHIRGSRYAPPTLVTVATSHKLSLSRDDKMAAGSHPRSLDS